MVVVLGITDSATQDGCCDIESGAEHEDDDLVACCPNGKVSKNTKMRVTLQYLRGPIDCIECADDASAI